MQLMQCVQPCMRFLQAKEDYLGSACSQLHMGVPAAASAGTPCVGAARACTADQWPQQELQQQLKLLPWALA
jgi:hypothetical protein